MKSQWYCDFMTSHLNAFSGSFPRKKYKCNYLMCSSLETAPEYHSNVANKKSIENVSEWLILIFPKLIPRL